MAAGRKPVNTDRKALVGKRMEIAAKQAGFKTGTEVADALGVQQGTVSRWWLGRSLPEVDEMDRYAELVGQTPGWFYEYGDNTLEDLVAERLIAIFGMMTAGSRASEAFDAATRVPAALSPRERRQVDASTPAMRARLKRAARVRWEELSPDQQRQIVDHLSAVALRPEGE